MVNSTYYKRYGKIKEFVKNEFDKFIKFIRG